LAFGAVDVTRLPAHAAHAAHAALRLASHARAARAVTSSARPTSAACSLGDGLKRCEVTVYADDLGAARQGYQTSPEIPLWRPMAGRAEGTYALVRTVHCPKYRLPEAFPSPVGRDLPLIFHCPGPPMAVWPGWQKYDHGAQMYVDISPWRAKPLALVG